MQASVRKTDGLVVQYGSGVGEREDCDIVELDDVRCDELLNVMPKGEPAVVTVGVADVYDEEDPTKVVDQVKVAKTVKEAVIVAGVAAPKSEKIASK